MTIKKAMIEIRKFRVERQIVDALNIENDSIVISIHDLSLNSDVLMWRDNLNQRDKWIESFKLLNIDDETCKIVLSSESVNFRSTVIKSFLSKSINDLESTNENVQSISEIENIQSSDHQNNLSATTLEIIRSFAITRSFEITRSFAITKSTRAKRLSFICKTGKRLLMRYRIGSRASSSSARVSLESSCFGYSITVKLNSRHQLLQ